jgi:hypothetical protein
MNPLTSGKFPNPRTSPNLRIHGHLAQLSLR